MKNRLEDALRGVDLRARSRVAERSDIRMRVAVIAEFVAFVPDAPDEIRIALGVLSDEEERRLHVVLFEDVEHLRGVRIRGTVIDRQRDLFLFVPAASDHVRRWKLVVGLVEEQAGRGIDFDRPRSIARQRTDMQNLAVTDKLDVVWEVHVLEHRRTRWEKKMAAIDELPD